MAILTNVVEVQFPIVCLITWFLLSLAKTCSSRSIAVILSGMGFDGSSALRNIKQAGGMVFAQSDAVYGDMPQSAIGTGYVDFSLSATQIGRRLGAMRFSQCRSSVWHSHS